MLDTSKLEILFMPVAPLIDFKNKYMLASEEAKQEDYTAVNDDEPKHHVFDMKPSDNRKLQSITYNGKILAYFNLKGWVDFRWHNIGWIDIRIHKWNYNPKKEKKQDDDDGYGYYGYQWESNEKASNEIQSFTNDEKITISLADDASGKCPWKKITVEAPESEIDLGPLENLEELVVRPKPLPIRKVYSYSLQEDSTKIELKELPNLKVLDIKDYKDISHSLRIGSIPLDCKIIFNPNAFVKYASGNPMTSCVSSRAKYNYEYKQYSSGLNRYSDEEGHWDYEKRELKISDFCPNVDPNKPYEITYGEYLRYYWTYADSIFKKQVNDFSAHQLQDLENAMQQLAQDRAKEQLPEINKNKQ